MAYEVCYCTCQRPSWPAAKGIGGRDWVAGWSIDWIGDREGTQRTACSTMSRQPAALGLPFCPCGWLTSGPCAGCGERPAGVRQQAAGVRAQGAGWLAPQLACALSGWYGRSSSSSVPLHKGTGATQPGSVAARCSRQLGLGGRSGCKNIGRHTGLTGRHVSKGSRAKLLNSSTACLAGAHHPPGGRLLLGLFKCGLDLQEAAKQWT